MRKANIAVVMFNTRDEAQYFLENRKYTEKPEVKEVGYFELADGEEFDENTIWAYCSNPEMEKPSLHLTGKYAFVAASSLAIYNPDEKEWNITQFIGFKKVKKETLELEDFFENGEAPLGFFPSFIK